MKKYLYITVQIGGLFLFYFIGSWIQNLLNIAIPGSIIGMILLFILLTTKIIPIKWIEEGSFFLLSHMTLLFIPVTVGVMNYFSLFKGKGLLSLLIAFISTVIVFAVSGHVSQWIAKRKDTPAKKMEYTVEKE